jgi:hypothetical protein
MDKSTTASCCGPTCCGGTKESARAATLTDAIRQKYAQTARSSLSNDSDAVQAVAEAFGYSVAELTSIPAAANMGLSCGNPIGRRARRVSRVTESRF